MRIERTGVPGWAAALAAGLLLGACAAPGVVADGRDRDGAWRELASDHFTVATDVSPESARRLVQELELDRALLVAAMPALGEDAGRLPVYVFRSADEFWAVTGSRTDYVGHAYQDEWGRRSLAMRLSPQGEVLERQVMVAHELVHALSLRAIPYQPRWFAEGLATWLSSVAREKDGRRTVGSPPYPGLERVDPISVRDLLGWRQEGSYGEGRYYETAWLLVRVLAAEEPAGFAELQRRYAAGEASEAGWNAAFPQYALDRAGAAERLDRLLRQRGQDREGSPRPVAATAAAAPGERLLSAAELHTLRLGIRERWEPEARLQEARAALRVDRGHVLALRACAELTEEEAYAVELARRAARAHPEDPRAWLLLADRLSRSYDFAEREGALRQAVRLAPDDPEVLLRLADEIGQASPEEAARLASRARETTPWSWAVPPLRAISLARVGQCPEARRSAELSVRLGGGEWAKELVALVEQECGAPEGRAEGLVTEANQALSKGRFELGLRLPERALALPASAPARAAPAWTARADALALLERPEEAAAAYRKALELDPSFPRALRNAGLALERLGKKEEAERLFRRHAEAAPRDAEAWLDLGLFLMRLERWQDAAGPLDRAAELEPKSARALLVEGRVQLAAQQKEAGLATLERAVARDGAPMTLNEAAWWLAAANVRVDRADGWADAAARGAAKRLAAIRAGAVVASEVRASRAVISAWDTLGWARARAGKLEDAARWLDAAERLVPNAITAYHLGAVLEARGRAAEAADAYARAAVLDPKSPARVRVAAAAGEGAVSGALAKARTDLRDRRQLAVPGADGGEDVAGLPLELVLAANGRVAEVRAQGGAPLPAGAEGLRGLELGVRFPDPGVPSLVVNASWRCKARRCAAVIGEEGR